MQTATTLDIWIKCDLVTRVSQPIETLHVIQEIRKLANIGTCRRNGGIFKQDTHHVWQGVETWCAHLSMPPHDEIHCIWLRF